MYEASNVQLGEYVIKRNDQRIVCTDEELRHINEEHEEPRIETIVIDEISEIRRDTDESYTGFKKLSFVFAAVALTFTVVSIPLILAGMLSTPIAGGSYLSTILSWFGFVTFYQMEHGTLDVLEIWVNDERHLLFTKKEDSTFDAVIAHLKRTSSTSITPIHL